MEKLLSFDIVTSDFNQATAALEIQDFPLASIINDSTNIYMAFDVIIKANMNDERKLFRKLICLSFVWLSCKTHLSTEMTSEIIYIKINEILVLA